MSGWLVTILVDAVISGTTVFGLLKIPIINTYLTSKINETSQKHLNEQKHELEALTLSSQYDYQKRLMDINHFVSKKHSVYPELYSLVLHCESIATNIQAVYQQPLSTIPELEKYIDHYPVLFGHRKQNLISILKQSGENVLRKTFNDHWLKIGIPQFDKLKNTFFQHALFLSDDVSQKVQAIWKTYVDYIENTVTITPSEYDRLKNMRTELQQIMRKELGYETI